MLAYMMLVTRCDHNDKDTKIIQFCFLNTAQKSLHYDILPSLSECDHIFQKQLFCDYQQYQLVSLPGKLNVVV